MVTILFSLRLYWCRAPYPYDLFLLAAPRVSPGAAVFVSSCPRSNNNLSNGSVLANFSPMQGNEANFCKGYDYNNKKFCFNYRGAESQIADYIFGDGKGGAIASLNDLVKKDDFAIKPVSLVATSETSASNLYALMKGNRELQISGWFNVSSTKSEGTKIFSLPSGYAARINTTILAMKQNTNTVVALWCEEGASIFTVRYGIADGGYYVIPITIQLKSV